MQSPEPHFTRRVENYIKYRPRYPQALIELLQREGVPKTAVLADIGSGTGMLTEVFLAQGHPVFGIEPDPAMRTAAEWLLRGYPHFTSIAATAEATTLPEQSIDVITVGQAFHWFDLERARREFVRLLVPGGWVMLVWNHQRTAGTPFLVALEGFWQTYFAPSVIPVEETSPPSGDFRALHSRVNAWRVHPERARQELIVPFFGPNPFKEQYFENPLVCDFESLKGRVFSAGTAPTEDQPLYAEMLASLEAIFEAHQTNGVVIIDHETQVYYGQLSLPVAR
jgi:SAM-dependent methyltransferase